MTNWQITGNSVQRTGNTSSGQITRNSEQITGKPSGVGCGGVGWDVSMKSMGSSRGGAPHEYAGEGVRGGGRPISISIHGNLHQSIFR